MPSQIHPRGGAFSEEPLRRCKKQMDVRHRKLHSMLCGDLKSDHQKFIVNERKLDMSR